METEKLGEFELNKIYCIEVTEFLKKIPDQSIDFVCCDFPYNISNYGNSLTKKGNNIVKGDFGEWDKWKNMQDYLDWVFKICNELKRISKPLTNLILFFDNRQAGWIAYELERRKILSYKSPIILVKNNPIPHVRKTGFRSSFEHIVWLVNVVRENEFDSVKGYQFEFLSQKEMCNVMNYNIGQKDSGSRKEGIESHPTEKPLKIISNFVKIFSKENDICLDCFMGSGTLALACKQLNRHFIGCDISPEYVKIANKRLAQEVLF